MIALPPGAPSPTKALASIIASTKNASPNQILHKILLEGAQVIRPPQETVNSSQTTSAPDLRWAFGPGRTDLRRPDEQREESAKRDLQLGRFDLSKYTLAQGGMVPAVDVRVAVADKGGTVEPGWNLIYDGLNRSELIVPPRDRGAAPPTSSLMGSGGMSHRTVTNTISVPVEVNITGGHGGLTATDITLAVERGVAKGKQGLLDAMRGA